VTSCSKRVCESLPRPHVIISRCSHGWRCIASCMVMLHHQWYPKWPSNPKRWHHHQMKANIKGVGHHVQGGEGCISSLQGIQLSTGATFSIKWVIILGVHCPTCRLPSHMCAIMTKSIKTNPIYPLSKVLKMWEPMSVCSKSLGDSLLCITRAKILQ